MRTLLLLIVGDLIIFLWTVFLLSFFLAEDWLLLLMVILGVRLRRLDPDSVLTSGVMPEMS